MFIRDSINAEYMGTSPTPWYSSAMTPLQVVICTVGALIAAHPIDDMQITQTAQPHLIVMHEARAVAEDMQLEDEANGVGKEGQLDEELMLDDKEKDRSSEQTPSDADEGFTLTNLYPQAQGDEGAYICPSCDKTVDTQTPDTIGSTFDGFDLAQVGSGGWRLTVYTFGSVWVDCVHGVPARFDYNAYCDDVRHRRYGSFSLPSDSYFSNAGSSGNDNGPMIKVDGVEYSCQQNNARPYPSYCMSPLCGVCNGDEVCENQCNQSSDPSVTMTNGQEVTRVANFWNSKGIGSATFMAHCNDYVAFDRGHMVPTNHLGHNTTMFMESNFMTNINPQVANLNRGAWLQSEMLIERWRDYEALNVIGGAVFNDADDEEGLEGRNEWFRDSHGIQNPVAFWKVIKAKNSGTIFDMFGTDHIAFWMPNDRAATGDDYVVTLNKLEALLDQHGQAETFSGVKGNKSYCFGMTGDGSDNIGCKTWWVPARCNRD
eukprot:NODE_7593_length_1565_cov_4.162726.p1 GENE.NODE_7593_length_1565_cov_4.162726~~NODE_7593_length_1565_cov_4.162726.p1  ORF type:complete len:486 (+),score=129.57 NODE_7593_length_1565_cov_4.162726:59-1516(+)